MLPIPSKTANDTLIKNLENQVERLVEQLKDLDDCREELPEDEYDSMKQDTVEQINEFTETLDRMNKGDVSLNNTFSTMRTAIRQAIASSFNTIEMIKLFGHQSITDLEGQLLALDEEYRLKKINLDEFESKKIIILRKLKDQGYCLSQMDIELLEKQINADYLQMEQVEY